MAPRVPKMEAPGMPNDTFWTPGIAIPVSKVTAISKNAMKTNLKKQTCLHTFHRKTKQIKTPKNQ